MGKSAGIFGLLSKKVRYGIGFSLGMFLLISVIAHAQLTTGTITGTVTDPSGAAIPGAGITVKSVDTGTTRNSVAGPTGRYEIANLPVGKYDVSSSLAGFQTSIRAGVELTVGKTAVV